MGQERGNRSETTKEWGRPCNRSFWGHGWVMEGGSRSWIAGAGGPAGVGHSRGCQGRGSSGRREFQSHFYGGNGRSQNKVRGAAMSTAGSSASEISAQAPNRSKQPLHLHDHSRKHLPWAQLMGGLNIFCTRETHHTPCMAACHEQAALSQQLPVLQAHRRGCKRAL
jgi:hypothetical protein